MGDADADADRDPIQSFWYMYVFPGGGSQRTKNQEGRHGRNREKANQKIHSFIPKKKGKDRKRTEKREEKPVVPHNAHLLRYLVFVSFVLAFIPLSYRHTDRSRPTFCLYLALTYMDLLSRTVLSVELDEI